MGAEELIRARLLASAPLAAAIGSAIYAGCAPQNVQPPFLVMQRISGQRQHALTDMTDIKTGRFQIDSYATDYDDAVRNARLAAAAVETNSGTDLRAEMEGEFDILEEETPPLWRRSMDFWIMERSV